MRRYRELLAIPGVRRLTLAVLLSRVTTSMLNLALLVAVTQAHGYAVAGLVLMAFAVSNAVVGPARGRLADRREPRQVLLRLLAGHAVAYLGLLACLLSTAPVAPLLLVLPPAAAVAVIGTLKVAGDALVALARRCAAPNRPGRGGPRAC